MSVFGKSVADAANERGGFSSFRFNGRKRSGIDGILGEAGAFDADGAVVRFRSDRNNVEIDGGGKHLAVIVVGVVAADLTASRDGENG